MKDDFRIEYPASIKLDLSKEEAELLLARIEDTGLARIKSQIKNLLRPVYVYKVKCEDCSRTYEHKTLNPLPDKLIRTGICNNCMEDYK